MKIRKVNGAAIVAAVLVLLAALIPQTASAADASFDTLDAPTQEKISQQVEEYRQLLEAAYNTSSLDASAKEESNKLFLASPAEQQVAKRQTDYILDAFTSAGLSIDKVTVAVSIDSVSKTGQNYVVKTDIIPTVSYQRIDENHAVVHSTCWWTDQHEITIAGQEGTLQNKSSRMAAPSSVIGDTLIPEPLAAPVTTPSEGEQTDTGITTEQALSQRGSVVQPRTAAMPQLPNLMDGVRYALKWTAPPYDGDADSDFNPAFKRYDNNCANFVSQSVYAGGAPLRTEVISINTRDTNQWTYDLIFGKPTWTWVNAAYNYEFMKNYYYHPNNDIWSEWGDLIYADWDSDGTKDHVMIITQSDRYIDAYGKMRFHTCISQKTNNRHNIPLDVEIAIASQNHKHITWYSLVKNWI